MGVIPVSSPTGNSEIESAVLLTFDQCGGRIIGSPEFHRDTLRFAAIFWLENGKMKMRPCGKTGIAGMTNNLS